MSIPTAPSISITAAPRWGRGSSPRSRRSSPKSSACRCTSCASPRPIPRRFPTPRRPPPRRGPTSTAWRPRSPPERSRNVWPRSPAEHWGVAREAVEFRDGLAFAGNHSMSFDALAKACRLARVQLSHAGYYKTPEIHWDRAKAQGRPFFYFAYGAACSEVAIDTMTGRNAGAARRSPARRRRLDQSGDRHRPGRGRLHSGHGLADDRGARLRRTRGV